MEPHGQSPCLHAEVFLPFRTQAWSSAQADETQFKFTPFSKISQLPIAPIERLYRGPGLKTANAW
jgi:hypothetical protein